MMRFLFCFFLLSVSGSAHAFFQYAPNRAVREEVEQHEFRILPRSDTFVMALDGDFFKPVFVGSGEGDYYREDFYHGNGYWLDLRGEFQPTKHLVLNLRTTLTQGTTSNGPTFNALVIPRLGLTYRQSGFLGLEWETRLGDVDRQTLGSGIFIEQKETAGGTIAARGGDFHARLLVDGTGSFTLDGGVAALEVIYGEGVLGATVMMLERDVGYRPPQFTGTLFSKGSFTEGFGYRAEAGGNELNYAALAGLDYEVELDRFKLRIGPQYRHYGRKLFGDLANRFYGVYARSEWFAFRFHDRPDVSGIFYRAGFRFFPFPGREDEFGLLIGNQYLIASTLGDSGRVVAAPNQFDLENKPLFMQQTFWMVHFSIKM